jgi:hypothetical protein
MASASELLISLISPCPVFEAAHRSPPFSSMNSTAALCERRIARLALRAHLLFNGFAEFDVALRHVWRDVALREERQDSVDPSEVLHDLASFCALRGGALSSSTDKLPGGFGLGRKNRNEAFAIDVDE